MDRQNVLCGFALDTEDRMTFKMLLVELQGGDKVSLDKLRKL